GQFLVNRVPLRARRGRVRLRRWAPCLEDGGRAAVEFQLLDLRQPRAFRRAFGLPVRAALRARRAVRVALDPGRPGRGSLDRGVLSGEQGADEEQRGRQQEHPHRRASGWESKPTDDNGWALLRFWGVARRERSVSAVIDRRGGVGAAGRVLALLGDLAHPLA